MPVARARPEQLVVRLDPDEYHIFLGLKRRGNGRTTSPGAVEAAIELATDHHWGHRGWTEEQLRLLRTKVATGASEIQERLKPFHTENGELKPERPRDASGPGTKIRVRISTPHMLLLLEGARARGMTRDGFVALGLGCFADGPEAAEPSPDQRADSPTRVPRTPSRGAEPFFEVQPQERCAESPLWMNRYYRRWFGEAQGIPRLRPGTSVLLDDSVVYSALARGWDEGSYASPECRRLLQRCAVGDLRGFMTAAAVSRLWGHLLPCAEDERERLGSLLNFVELAPATAEDFQVAFNRHDRLITGEGGGWGFGCMTWSDVGLDARYRQLLLDVTTAWRHLRPGGRGRFIIASCDPMYWDVLYDCGWRKPRRWGDDESVSRASGQEVDVCRPGDVALPEGPESAGGQESFEEALAENVDGLDELDGSDIAELAHAICKDQPGAPFTVSELAAFIRTRSLKREGWEEIRHWDDAVFRRYYCLVRAGLKNPDETWLNLEESISDAAMLTLDESLNDAAMLALDEGLSDAAMLERHLGGLPDAERRWFTAGG